jgi:serine/threonine protein kinase
MVIFVCSHCGRKIQVQPDRIDQKVKCTCGQMVTVSIGTSTSASGVHSSGVPSPAAVGEETTALPPPAEPQRGTTSELETRGNGGAQAAPAKELYDFLAPPQAPGEMGWLGPYRVLKILGAGGMGVVFQAEDSLLKRPVALKAMKPALASSESARARFTREAIAIAAIKHDHIVTIYQVGNDRGVPFLSMEFLEGEALDARLQSEGALPVAEVVRIGREIAEGLAAAHQRGLIHRDIKPANIWLEGERRRVKILDFGLARAVAGDGLITQSGVILGTPAYMAPEQARSEKIDPRCDLFSLGCVLYHLATGRMPFQGKDTMSILMALAVDTPPPPQELRGEIPASLSGLIQELLAKNVIERPVSAQEVVQRLRQIEEGKPHEARPIPVAKVAELPTILDVLPADPAKPKASARARRRSSRPSCCCLAVILLFVAPISGLAFLVVSLWLGRPDRQSADQVGPAIKKLAEIAKEFAQQEGPEQEWISLFNGKDLAGWEKLGEGKWTVVNGILKGDGKGIGWLATKRTFADLELELVYHLSYRGDSGVFLRARKDAPVDGRDFLEIQLRDDANYPGAAANTLTGALLNEAAPVAMGRFFPAGQWAKLRVRAEGQRIRVWVDGVPLLDHPTQRGEKSGLLGLQMLSTPVEFRKIRVRELSPRDENSQGAIPAKNLRKDKP